MSTEVIVYVLTALAAVVVVLTRLRLGREDPGAGRLTIARGPVGLHFVAGVVALVTWVAYLALGGTLDEGAVSIVGIVALVAWWTTALAGLLILVRWLPARGRHASGAVGDSWSEGPGLSILGHLGMVAGVVVFTVVYVVDAV